MKMKKVFALAVLLCMLFVCMTGMACAESGCTCAEHCTAENFNEYCDVCGMDYTACTGEDTAATYGTSEFIVENGVLTGYTGSGGAVVIPAEVDGVTVTTIGEKAFYDNKTITSVTTPETITTIEESAFDGCIYLTSITLPDSLETIGAWAFYNCYRLSAITLGSGLESIGEHAFDHSGLQSITIPDSVTTLGSYAFAYCDSLSRFTLGNGITSIPDHAFANCSSLTSLSIPDTVDEIGDYAFSECTSLTSVIVPASITKDSVNNSYAFNGCTHLSEAVYLGTGDLEDETFFDGCTNLDTVKVTCNYNGQEFCGKDIDEVVAEIKELFITVDGVTYTTDDDTDDKVVITPETKSIIYTVTGDNLFYAHAFNYVYYRPDTTFYLYDLQIDTQDTTVVYDASPELSNFTDCSGFEITYSNDGNEIGTGISLIYCAQHTGDTATCISKAECTTCGTSYGELGGHSTTAEGDKAATCTTKAYCSRCESEYGEVLGHSTDAEGDKAATCTSKAYCSRCEREYGELAAHTLNENGLCACGYQYAAKNGTTFYDTVKNALTAAQNNSGCTVVLLDDIKVANDSYSGQYALTVKGNFTLDLNGKHLSSNANTLMVMGTLTICDNAGGGKIGGAGMAVFVYGDDEAALTVEGGSFVGPTDAIFADYGTTVTIKGGTFAGSRGMITVSSGNLTLDLTAIDPTGFTIFNNGQVSSLTPILPTGYGMVDSDGKLVEELAPSKGATVHKHEYTYVDVGDGKHKQGCTCGATTGEAGNHTKAYKANDAGDTVITYCSVCNAELATLTISATGKTYDGEACKVTISDTGAGDTITMYLIRYSDADGNSLDDAPVSAGTYTASITKKGVIASVEFTIAPKRITVTADATSKTYGSDDPILTYISAGLVGSDFLSGDLARAAGEDVGTYAISVGSLANDNYIIDFTGADLTINPKGITVAANAVSKTYGDADPELTCTAHGLIGSDKLSGDLARAAGEDVGTYSIQQGTLTAGDNYDISYIDAVLTVNPRTITITGATIEDVLYREDGQYTLNVTDVTFDGLVDELVPGTDYTAVAALDGGNALGEVPASVTVTLLNHNYTLGIANTVEASVNIVEHAHEWNYDASGNSITAVCSGAIGVCNATNKRITLAAPAGSMVYDGQVRTATLEGSIDGVTNPAISYEGDCKSVGVHIAKIRLGDAEASVSFTITAATPVVAWATTAETVTFTGSPAAITAPTVTLVNGETFAGDISYSYTGASSGNGLPTDAGMYEITASIAAQDNYAEATSTNTLTLTIGKAATSVVPPPAANNLTYNGSAQALVAAGSASGGTMQYSLNGTDFGPDIPSAADAGDYTVYYKVVGDGNHTDTDVLGPVAVSIAKAQQDAPTGLTAVYGQKLSSVILPEGWSWMSPDAAVGSAGASIHKANYAGSANYLPAQNVDVTVTVGQSATDMTAKSDKTAYTYGETVSITVTPAATGASAYSLRALCRVRGGGGEPVERR